MHKKFNAIADTYITDKITSSNKRAKTANVGKASTLDLYKLYNENEFASESEPIELTRLLLKFDTSAISSSLSNVDFSDSSFKVELELSDLQGAQIAPSNYTVSVYALSQSFEEGVGTDVSTLSHVDSSNWITASMSNGTPVLWNTTGAGAEGLLGSSDIDIISSGNIGSGVEKLFVDKEITTRNSNLLVDVTKIFSASATGIMPDHGFLIKFSSSIEANTESLFVKRFSSIQSANSLIRPTLHVKYDDFIIDDRMFATYNVSGSLYLKNSVNGAYANLLSGSTEISGANCLLVSLNYKTNNYAYLTASQALQTGHALTGFYSASFNIDGLNTYISTSYEQAKTITIHEKWTTLDENILFYTGSFDVQQSSSGFGSIRQNKQVVITNLNSIYKTTEIPRINIFVKQFLKDVQSVRTPVVAKSDFEKFVYYQIRAVKSNKVVIPFSDFTRCSVDTTGIYFDLPTHSLPAGFTYKIDIKIVNNSNQIIYAIDNSFKIE